MIPASFICMVFPYFLIPPRSKPSAIRTRGGRGPLDIGAAIRIPPPFCTKTGAFSALALVKSHKRQENNTQNGRENRRIVCRRRQWKPLRQLERRRSRWKPLRQLERRRSRWKPLRQTDAPPEAVEATPAAGAPPEQVEASPRGSSPQCAI